MFQPPRIKSAPGGMGRRSRTRRSLPERGRQHICPRKLSLPQAHLNRIGPMNDRDAFETALKRATGAINLVLDEKQLTCMWQHFTLMVEANRRFNLTRITDPAEAAVKHYADSLSLLATPWANPADPLAVLDVGTGAGFPAIPLAAVCENWSMTAIDSTGKKARFVSDAGAVLGLPNLNVRHVRAADLARHWELRFDLVLMRAVAQIARGIEEVHSLVNPTGAIVFYKSAEIRKEELAAGAAEARRRGLAAVTIHALQLPISGATLERRLIRYARSP